MRVPAPVRFATISGLLVFGAIAPVAAQQRPDTTRVADTARAAADTLPGPRIQPRWQPAPQRLVPDLSRGALAPEETHTFRFTTLELILIGVIIFILIVH